MARNDFDPTTVKPDGRPPAQARLFDPAADGPWRGSVDGTAIGGPVTVLAYGTDTVGAGPRLHVHPYDETFIIVEGRARFFVGDTTIDAAAVKSSSSAVFHSIRESRTGRLQTVESITLRADPNDWARVRQGAT